MLRLIAVLSIAVVLTGCSAQTSGSTSSAPKATYSTVEELRAAFVKAGGECNDWVQGNRVALAAESGDCSSASVLSIYLSHDDVSQMAKNMKNGGFGVHLLIGENWAINTPNPKQYLNKLGGTVVTSD